MTPKEFIERLQAIAQEARCHPEPAVAVSLLAQLLLDLSLELMPLAQKYGLLLQASGFLDHLEASANQASADLQATASSSAEPVTLEAGTVEALAALVDPALAAAPEFAAETPAA